MAGFQHDIAGGSGDLIIPMLQSPDFSIADQTGWAILKNGDAYFFNIVAEGSISSNTVVVSGSGEGVFLYSGVPAAGNLVGAWAQSNGTDAFGNTYISGIIVGIESFGPQVAIFPAAAAGYAGGIEFPMPTPALSNIPSLSASALPYIALSGPALATTGEKDWAQIIIWGYGDPVGQPSRVEFRRISTTGAVTVSAVYNNTGWTFNDPVNLAGGTEINGNTLTIPQSSPAIGTNGFGGGVWTAGQQSALLTMQAQGNDIITQLQAAGIFD